MATQQWREANRDKMRAYRRKWNAKHPEYYAEYFREHMREYQRDYQRKYRKKRRRIIHAQSALNTAVKSGRIVRPPSCSACGKQCKPEAHHYKGYARQYWLVVVWLCRRCHDSAHHN